MCNKSIICGLLLASGAITFYEGNNIVSAHVSIPKRHYFSPLCVFCACYSSVLQNFKIFTHVLTEVEFESYVECNFFNDRARKVRKILATNTVMRYFILHTAFMDRKSTLKKQRGR
jgi:hypothetical protein